MNIRIDSDKRNEPIKGKIKNSSHLITLHTFFRQIMPEKADIIIDFLQQNTKENYCKILPIDII
jgi:hypothetical protein